MNAVKPDHCPSEDAWTQFSNRVILAAQQEPTRPHAAAWEITKLYNRWAEYGDAIAVLRAAKKDGLL